MAALHLSGGRISGVAVLLLAELLLAVGLVAVLGWADLRGRAVGPESAFVAYAEALGREDLAGALEQLAPDLRSEAAPFVEWQLGNRLAIVESVVRTDALLDRLTGRPPRPPVVVVTLEVHEAGTPPWRTVQELPAELVEGRWHLLQVPLQPPDGSPES